MKTKEYTLELFDSRNTSTTEQYRGTRKDALIHAKYLSSVYYKVIIYAGKGIMSQDWEQYEGGKKTEWSYPDGLGGIMTATAENY
mgnify:CR=1 FL=1